MDSDTKGMPASLHPQFYISRTDRKDGLQPTEPTLVPLIPADLLPDWMEIVGVPRTLEEGDILGMHYVGAYPPTDDRYSVEIMDSDMSPLPNFSWADIRRYQVPSSSEATTTNDELLEPEIDKETAAIYALPSPPSSDQGDITSNNDLPLQPPNSEASSDHNLTSTNSAPIPSTPDTPPPSPPKEHCKRWHQSGHCKFGHLCWYTHCRSLAAEISSSSSPPQLGLDQLPQHYIKPAAATISVPAADNTALDSLETKLPSTTDGQNPTPGNEPQVQAAEGQTIKNKSGNVIRSLRSAISGAGVDFGVLSAVAAAAAGKGGEGGSGKTKRQRRREKERQGMRERRREKERKRQIQRQIVGGEKTPMYSRFPPAYTRGVMNAGAVAAIGDGRPVVLGRGGGTGSGRVVVATPLLIEFEQEDVGREEGEMAVYSGPGAADSDELSRSLSGGDGDVREGEGKASGKGAVILAPTAPGGDGTKQRKKRKGGSRSDNTGKAPGDKSEGHASGLRGGTTEKAGNEEEEDLISFLD